MTKENVSPAVEVVESLVMGDQLAKLLGSSSESRRSIWQESSSRFPEKQTEIMNLRMQLEHANATKEAYPETITNVIMMHWNEVQDVTAKQLLTDLLIARVSPTTGYIDYDKDMIEEANALAAELGYQNRNDKELGKATVSTILSQVIK